MPILGKKGRFEEEDDEFVLNVTSLQNLSDIQVECQVTTIHLQVYNIEERCGQDPQVWTGHTCRSPSHLERN